MQVCRYGATGMKGDEAGKDMRRHDGCGQDLGKPSMPLYRLKDFGRNRYKDHWNRMHGLQMASKTRCNAKLHLTAA